MQLAQLDNDNAIKLENIRAANAQLVQNTQSAGVTMATAMQEISSILNNPDITTPNKQALIDKQISLLNDSLAVLASMTGASTTGVQSPSIPGSTNAPPATNTIPSPVVGQGSSSQPIQTGGLSITQTDIDNSWQEIPGTTTIFGFGPFGTRKTQWKNSITGDTQWVTVGKTP